MYAAVILLLLAPAPFLNHKPPDVVGEYYDDGPLLNHHIELLPGGRAVWREAGAKDAPFPGKWRLGKLQGHWVVYVDGRYWLRGTKYTVTLRVCVEDLRKMRRRK